MSTDELLSMLQLADSFFPAGTYTMSNGLEALFKQKKLDAGGLAKLIKTYMERQIGPADVAALGGAHERASAGDLAGVLAVDSALYSMKLVEEVRSALARSGAQTVRTVAAFLPESKVLAGYESAIKQGRATGVYPVALAVVCAEAGIPKQKAGTMMLYSFCVGMAGAALRLGAIDHVAAQKILHELKPAIAGVVEENIGRPASELWQFAPGIDVWQVAHERLDSKMFIT
jgi:urease accessory protein